MQEVIARRVKYHSEMLNPGDFYMSSPIGEIRTLIFQCPCGCETTGRVAISKTDSSVAWTWDGNEERPTITPSISFVGGCNWHGHLTNGIFRSC